MASAAVSVSVSPPTAALAETSKIFIPSAPSCPAETMLYNALAASGALIGISWVMDMT